MRDRVKKTIERYRMLEKGDRVGIAVSGGPDSVALLKVLHELHHSGGFSLVVLHLNHCIRGEESDHDAAFVTSLGAQLGIPVEVKTVSIPQLKRRVKGSIEEIARNERYAFFRNAADTHHLTKVALGHTLNDQVETVLINIMRGSGPEGLRGMLPVRDGIFIRPLIESTREEVLSFLQKEGLTFTTDATNESDEYLRNRVRHFLIPELERTFDRHVTGNISRMAEIIRYEDEYMKKAAMDTLNTWGIITGAHEYRMNITLLRGIHVALVRRMVKALLEELSPGNNGIEYRHVQEVIDLVESRSPCGVVSLPFSITAARDYDMIHISRGRTDDSTRRCSSRTQSTRAFTYPVTIPGSVEISETGEEIRFSFVTPEEVHFECGVQAFMDYDALMPPLSVRNMREGDRIQPLGMKGYKKLKALFIDEKIPWRKRKIIPLVADSHSVVWIPGVRLSERVRITDATERVVKVEII